MAERDDDNDESERLQAKPSAKPPRDEHIQPAKPRPTQAPDDWDEEADDRPRRRRAPDVRRRDDGVSSLIPYNNGMALAGYYLGVFSLIPALGVILGPLGIIFGIAGLRRVNRNPEVKGTGHAVTAIVLGAIGALYNWAFVAFIVIGIVMSRR